MTEPESGVELEVRGRLGVITLNRPKALNALTMEMIEVLDPALAGWAEDPAIATVAIRGAGDKAFCAGGDVVAVWRAGKEGGRLTADFFRAEYRLNYRIATYPKPFVAFLDGVTMGGGVGLSVHGSHRIGGDRLLFAMPETHIGLFPDVGGAHFMPRLGYGLGLYLGLTGRRLDCADCFWAGIATHYVPSDRHEALLEALIEAPDGGIDSLIPDFAGRPAALPSLAKVVDRVSHHFSEPDIDAVFASLAADPDPWAAETLAVLKTASPTSLFVTTEELRRGAALDLAGCLKMEYRLSQAAMAGHDFYEGIRAVLIDKDKAPKWQPASLEALDRAALLAAFDSPAPGGDLELPGVSA